MEVNARFCHGMAQFTTAAISAVGDHQQAGTLVDGRRHHRAAQHGEHQKPNHGGLAPKPMFCHGTAWVFHDHRTEVAIAGARILRIEISRTRHIAPRGC